jgi:hypothetical protein
MLLLLPLDISTTEFLAFGLQKLHQKDSMFSGFQPQLRAMLLTSTVLRLWTLAGPYYQHP